MVLLDISNQGLRTLPFISEDVTELNCSGNNLMCIFKRDLPVGLKKLNCSNNQLYALWVPQALTWLDCSNNSIDNLGRLPLTLKYLYCDSNKLVILPRLPALRELSCEDNPLLIPTENNTLSSYSQKWREFRYRITNDYGEMYHYCDNKPFSPYGPQYA